MIVLALNSGSNSLKFEVIRLAGMVSGEDRLPAGETLLNGSYDNIGKDQGSFSLLDGARQVQHRNLDLKDYGHAAELLCNWLDAGNAREQGLGSLRGVERIGHRVVHGADLFDGPALVTDDVIRRIESLEDLAPLHNQSALQVIRATRKKTGGSIPTVAAFDTVFHRTIPDEAATYALPRDLATRHKIRRYGFHGLSHRYLALRFSELAAVSFRSTKLITVHLEGGSSAAAIRNGASIETSMGFTPLEGLVMGTRTGDLDPAIVPYLMRKENWDSKRAEEFLNKKCGLLGLSGHSADTRELIQKLDEPQVNSALRIFSHRVRRYIGSYLAVLNGADAIVLGGGISENTPLVREWILNDLDWFGLHLDGRLNAETVNREGRITTSGSRLPVWVIPTRENLMVAFAAASLNLNAS